MTQERSEGYVILGPNGEVERVGPSPTAEEVAEANAALIRVAAALGRLMAQRDFKAARRERAKPEA